MKLFHRFLLWLLKITGWAEQEESTVHTERAITLCRQQNQERPNATSENKRHQVLAQLVKEYPEAEKCDLAFAIELAVQAIRHAG